MGNCHPREKAEIGPSQPHRHHIARDFTVPKLTIPLKTARDENSPDVTSDFFVREQKPVDPTVLHRLEIRQTAIDLHTNWEEREGDIRYLESTTELTARSQEKHKEWRTSKEYNKH